MRTKGCPYCGQGVLRRVTIRSIQRDSFICDECDTVWLKYEDVGDAAGVADGYLRRWIGPESMSRADDFEYHEVYDWPSF